MGAMSPTHWLIIVGVLVLLFGAKRLPDAARSLGRSARILKAEVKEAGADEKRVESAQPATNAPAPVALPACTEATPVVTSPSSPHPQPAVTPPPAA